MFAQPKPNNLKMDMFPISFGGYNKRRIDFFGFSLVPQRMDEDTQSLCILKFDIEDSVNFANMANECL